MISFFRHIRQKLLSQNRVTRYLIYALGEILLVVIGILIALQVNNWNEDRKAKIQSLSYLEEFKKDLVNDTINFNRILDLIETQFQYESWALTYLSYQPQHMDSLQRAFFSPYFNQPISDRTYQKLQSSDNPNLVGFPALFEMITFYYTEGKFLVDMFNESEKSFFVNNKFHENLSNQFEITLPDFPMMATEAEQMETLYSMAESIEGRNFIMEKYLRRKSMINVFNDVKKKAKLLIIEIDKYQP
ncbi:DUF6090 family protein [Algoriphagus namhaensis]|uniref:DUF6090 family protein n=1 Tax=Algoriphagus namhaensis TaxID=915353 RepID=A0ABV8ARA6_9BACT